MWIRHVRPDIKAAAVVITRGTPAVFFHSNRGAVTCETDDMDLGVLLDTRTRYFYLFQLHALSTATATATDLQWYV